MQSLDVGQVVTSTANSNGAPYVKAAIRDVKAYLLAKGSNVMVGYAAADGTEWRTDLAFYLACGAAGISLDLYGLNNYEVRRL